MNKRSEAEPRPSKPQHCRNEQEYTVKSRRPEEIYCQAAFSEKPPFKPGVKNLHREK